MSTDREKSFLASLRVPGAHLDFSKVEDHHDIGPKMDHYGYGNVEDKRLHANSYAVDPALLYFRYRKGHYVIFNRTKAVVNVGYFGIVSYPQQTDSSEKLCRFNVGVPDDGSTFFDLFNLEGKLINLDDIAGDEISVSIRANSKYWLALDIKLGIGTAWFAPVYGTNFVKKGQIFTLKVLERNVPYTSDPNEV